MKRQRIIALSLAALFLAGPTLSALAERPARPVLWEEESAGHAYQRLGSKVAIDWTGGTIRVSGYGMVGPESHVVERNRFPMALSAAEADAKRNLAEALNGIKITASTTVGDMVVKTDRMTGGVRAFVVGARRVSERMYMDGDQYCCEIVMEAPIGSDGGFAAHILHYVEPEVRVEFPKPAAETLGVGLAGGELDWEALRQKAKESAYDRGQEAQMRVERGEPRPEAQPAPEGADDAGASGVLFDARGQDYAFNFFPAVKTEDGRSIYDFTALTETLEAGFFSPFAYSPDQGAKHERTRQHPLVIPAESVDGDALVISNEDGDKLLELNGQFRLLNDGRVLFIIAQPQAEASASE